MVEKLVVILSNIGGELDREVATAETAGAVAARMLRFGAADGDTIRIVASED